MFCGADGMRDHASGVHTQLVCIGKHPAEKRDIHRIAREHAFHGVGHEFPDLFRVWLTHDRCRDLF